MPVNRNALIRYKTIDKCLQNHYRKWTLENLIDACSDALYEYEGIDKGVSKRTIQGDIQTMRSDKLGYNAPILVEEKKYYTYEDPNYSITNIPLTDQDLGMLSDAVEFMKQFKGFSHFRDLDGMVQKLEDHIYSQKTHTKSVIDFEKNDNLKGLNLLDSLYQAIIKKQVVKISYQSFKARQANSFDFHPYLLKEYRNRWFVIGAKEATTVVLNLALDRIIGIEKSELLYEDPNNFNTDTYFENVIGVSVSPNIRPQKVLLYINHYHAPYVLTKPLHPSQEVVNKDHYGVTISLLVQHNFELEKAILGFGDGIKVLAPKRLRQIIKERLTNSIDLYNTDITEKGLHAAAQKLTHKGFTKLNRIYTRREIKHIGDKLHSRYNKAHHIRVEHQKFAHDILPEVTNIILNKNLRRLVKTIDPKAALVKVAYYHTTTEDKAYQDWHQAGFIYVKGRGSSTEGYKNEKIAHVCPPEYVAKNIFCIRIHLDDTSESNGLHQLIPGSHNKRLSKEEIELISDNSLPVTPELYEGNVLVFKPLILSSFLPPKTKKRRRIIHLDFCSAELPKSIEWYSKIDLQLIDLKILKPLDILFYF
jgi:predicted DNA-binding transcriptional regulator YafY/ectoine hydroxylase-related dioxygenase (phytanoyl-CoA dioxygenase family)